MFKIGWNQEWQDVLMQHFKIKNPFLLKDLIPKNCELDTFEGNSYIGLVSMKMTNVSQVMFPNFVLFKEYCELNVRTYVKYNGVPCVLFLSLDVNSLISVFGAKILYSLPYRYRNFFAVNFKSFSCLHLDNEIFNCEYEKQGVEKPTIKGSFEYWATERYHFVQNKGHYFYYGRIKHEPWTFSSAIVNNHNLSILDDLNLGQQHNTILHCNSLKVQTQDLIKVFNE